MAKEGQLTKFKPQYCQEIVDFFVREQPYREHEDDKGKIQLIPERMPFFEDFAMLIGVDVTTLLAWVNDTRNEKSKYKGPVRMADKTQMVTFSQAYAYAKHLQKKQLIEGAVAGAYAPQFSIFLAKNITDMKDEQIIHTPDMPKIPIKGDIEKMTAEAIDQALNSKVFNARIKKMRK